MFRRISRWLQALAHLVLAARGAPAERAATELGRALNAASLDPVKRAQILMDAVARLMSPKQMAMLLLDPERRKAMVIQPEGPGVPFDAFGMAAPVIQWLQGNDAPVIRWAQLSVLPQFQGAPEQEQRLFADLDADVLVPLRSGGSLIGVLALGAKASGGQYGSHELRVLTALVFEAVGPMNAAVLYQLERDKVAELESLAQMKSEFMLAISHQLKTPISAVKASAEILAEEGAASPEIRQRLIQAIARGADSLDRLVTELTEYGRMQTATLELHTVEANLGIIINDTCSLLQPLADDKGVRLLVDTPRHLPPIRVDPHRVQQVFSNLIFNAIKYTAPGGEVMVKAQREGAKLVTSVKDTGPGIAEEKQKWVFEAFWGPSDRPSGPAGTGLGLPIAKALTELHGGAIWLESKEGQGSTFYVALPLGP